MELKTKKQDVLTVLNIQKLYLVETFIFVLNLQTIYKNYVLTQTFIFVSLEHVITDDSPVT